MAISFTPKQQQVIDLHDSNILVSAAAGSGKTAVLVERIIQMICDEERKVDIDRLLIVTFTSAAASEMRERISDAIARRLQDNPGSTHLQRQATLLHNALITTIDSFGLFILKNHFDVIGLDPAFRIGDEGELKLMKQEVLGGILEQAFEQSTPAFCDCVEFFCPDGKEKALENHITKLASYATSYPWPKEWLLERKQDYVMGNFAEFLQSPCGEYLVRYVKAMLTGCVQKLEQAESLCLQPDGPYKYADLLEKELEQAKALAQCDFEECVAGLQTLTFDKLPPCRDDSVSKEKQEYAKKLRDGSKKIYGELRALLCETPTETWVEQSTACVGPIAQLIDLTIAFMEGMQTKKQEKKIIDFSDMEHFALDILVTREQGAVEPSPVALGYRQYFEEVLIDEYQDINRVQEELLKSISGEEQGHFNRFMVGDVKQSIYKFRLAEPRLFLEKHETYQESGNYRRIDLSMNFRSRSQVIDTVNDVFSRIMSKENGGIVYDEDAALYQGATYPENPDCYSELLLVAEPEKGEELNKKEMEAFAIAQKIQDMMEHFQVTDKTSGALRKLSYRDIVILLRTNAGWDEEFKKILEEQGIPVYITSKTGYFAATEVQELLQFLRVLDNPRQDIPLFGVMKSIFGAFSEEEIAIVHAAHSQVSLYEALQRYVSDENAQEPLREKVEAFLQMLTSYRQCTIYMPTRELLTKLIEDFEYLAYVTALPAGSKRKANVEMLLTKASEYEKTSYSGLFHFVRYMEQMEKYDVDYGEADLLDENADVVRIMSIHKSKGLEFPVTFVAGLAKQFNMGDTNEALIVDMDLGIATNHVDSVKRTKSKTLRKLLIAQKMREDNLAEELRVLYVAMTRAREKLILTATVKEPEKAVAACGEPGGERLTYMEFVSAKSYLDFLLPICGQTALRVSAIAQQELVEKTLKGQVYLQERFAYLINENRGARNGEKREALAKRFQFVYPYEALSGLYTKTTVSELKIAAMADADEAAFHSFEEKEIVPYIPEFMREGETVSGTVRGNAYHRTMELLPLTTIFEKQFETVPESFAVFASKLQVEPLAQSVHEMLLELKGQGRLTEEYYQALREKKIVHFLQSEIAYRMWRAQVNGKLYREQPFVLGIPASRLNSDFPTSETVLIQGIIDVYFIEDGKIVLLDYKTDVIESMAALHKRYDVQLDYYAEALSRLCAMPVAEKRLYSFYLEE